MSAQDSARDESKSMEQRISDWLHSQGYPLEMFVAAEFSRSNFRVIVSEYYLDIESGDSREIDVVAHVQQGFDDVLVRIEFVIECKSSRDKPWVLFTRRRALADPARVAQRGASKLGHRLLMELASQKCVQDLALFSLPEQCAYGVTQAFTTGNDVAYGAAMSVAKAAAGETQEADEYTDRGQPICLIVFPVIVVDGHVAEAKLQPDGELHVQAINESVLVWRNPVMHGLHNMITIVRREEVSAYVSRMKESCSALLKIAEATVPKLLESNRPMIG
jgi:hypothetical protein